MDKGRVGRQHQGMDRPGVRQVPEGSGEQGKMDKTGCKIISGAPTTLAVKGLMIMMTHTHMKSHKFLKKTQTFYITVKNISPQKNLLQYTLYFTEHTNFFQVVKHFLLIHISGQ